MENTLTWVRSILITTPQRWLTLAQALPAELAAMPPAAGEWSAIECLQHLVDVEKDVFPVRIEAILAGRNFPAFNPETESSKPENVSLAELVDQYQALRAQSLLVFERVKPEDLDKQAIHQELGQVTMRQLLNEWAAHDLNHTVQAERALMQSFIRDCGPWIVYFQDHVIDTNPHP